MADNVPVASAANSNQVQNAEQGADQARPGFFGTLKTLVVRMLFIYMISSFFRRSSTPTTGTEGQPEKQYSQNLYPKNLQMDLYMYLSEQETFTDFDNENALVWKKTGLMYGDWTSGPNGDGSYEKSMEIDTPEIYICSIIYMSKKATDMNRKNN
ncbi:unnamed protein product [Mytilus coruscus]|uniref:Uncharacterized protein n=1 Tax=Mytilus coruscus TaxID=42192 RepID=A0A6J8C5Y1_MYTCO|nr:unnamed protein product [Mytilus coruscus]